ncbi:C12orf73 isoform 9 [Pan troglodytes]|uniref:C12orf73 isoform 8 n=3 Tax=Pan TaxID=9596 RepID=A0A6D2WLB9_PANTR|nr:C12orf73 isoform 8 [Pan troglodytes]PNI65090.1 C12orf73 isoform 9 [Pan troglodytes]
MPAGVPMSTYLKMFAASLLAMCAGAEVVHRYYRPDLQNRITSLSVRELEGLGRVEQRRP